jgi:hypothetical protein
MKLALYLSKRYSWDLRDRLWKTVVHMFNIIRPWYICAYLPIVLPSFRHSLVVLVSRHYGTFLLQKSHHVEPQRKVSFTMLSALACDCFACCSRHMLRPRQLTGGSFSNCIQGRAICLMVAWSSDLGCGNPQVGNSVSELRMKQSL